MIKSRLKDSNYKASFKSLQLEMKLKELLIIASYLFIALGGYPSAPEAMVADENREPIAMTEDDTVLERIIEEDSLEREDRSK